ncbi:hypothetical protein F511_25797 [Dorcoceras hygrometricum]|uniref:C2HC zinc finger plants domain-containing protein n=1 Tax=Dorcoceras hygrometricum TaxID=472368 RepID=A0A2Z7CBE7_9LAMI|nr:hypothetical protein F511_25797 [Dorcoceras hygrometricum]
MNCTDADMMEAEAAAAPPQGAAINSDPTDAVRNLLSMARQLLIQDKPSQALQAVVTATKLQGGDEAVSQALNRARELYINKVQASAAAAELASLFAECAIAEAIPSQHGTSFHKMYEAIPSQHGTSFHKMYDHSTEPVAQGTSILDETGRSQIVLDAWSDGSSFVCLQCGGLVSSQRRDEHFAFWCCKI